MKLTLRDNCYLKKLEEPHIYDAAADELYLLDDDSFERVLALCHGAVDPEAAQLLDDAGLLQREARRDPVYREGRSADPSLRYLEVQITGRCDKACRHCYLGAPSDQDMEQKVFQDLLEEFSRAQGLKMMVSGGEPARHPRFRELAALLSGFPLRSILITHGEWISHEEAKWLKPLFHQVQVSLDGMKEGHDFLRGIGSFARATAGIRALGSAGVPVSVGTMVHGRNLDQFDQMSELVREMGAQEWDIDVPCPTGRWKGEDQTPDALRTRSEKLRYGYGGGFHGGSSGLACGSHLMTVAPDGTGAKCGFYLDSPAGRVRQGLAEVWNRMKHETLDSLTCDCDQLEVCAGGCRYRAWSLEGSDLAPDMVQCYARGVK